MPASATPALTATPSLVRAATPGPDSVPSPLSSPPRILVVEDDPDHYHLIREHASAGLAGALATRAEDLAEAERFARSSVFDIVLLDLGLPESRGLDTLTRATRMLPDLPIIVLTAQRDNRLGLGAVRLGAADFVDKLTLETAGLPLRIAFAIERFRTKTRIERTNTFLRGFVAMIGHDLRTPPRQIAALVDEIAAGAPDLSPESRACLQAVGERAEHLRTLLNGTLDYARHATLVPRPGTLRLGDVVERVRAEFEPADAARITLTADTTLQADPNLAYLIFRNLIANGLRYWRGTPSRVTVSGTRSDGWTTIDIADTGFGMSRDLLARVFEPAVRGVAAEEFDGTGFGLAIVKLLVEGHDGRIELSSSPGEGTLARLRFPEGATSRTLSGGLLAELGINRTRIRAPRRTAPRGT